MSLRSCLYTTNADIMNIDLHLFMLYFFDIKVRKVSHLLRRWMGLT